MLQITGDHKKTGLLHAMLSVTPYLGISSITHSEMSKYREIMDRMDEKTLFFIIYYIRTPCCVLLCTSSVALRNKTLWNCVILFMYALYANSLPQKMSAICWHFKTTEFIALKYFTLKPIYLDSYMLQIASWKCNVISFLIGSSSVQY